MKNKNNIIADRVGFKGFAITYELIGKNEVINIDNLSVGNIKNSNNN